MFCRWIIHEKVWLEHDAPECTIGGESCPQVPTAHNCVEKTAFWFLLMTLHYYCIQTNDTRKTSCQQASASYFGPFRKSWLKVSYYARELRCWAHEYCAPSVPSFYIICSPLISWWKVHFVAFSATSMCIILILSDSVRILPILQYYSPQYYSQWLDLDSAAPPAPSPQSSEFKSIFPLRFLNFYCNFCKNCISVEIRLFTSVFYRFNPVLCR